MLSLSKKAAMRTVGWVFGEAKSKEWCVDDVCTGKARQERILPKHHRDYPGRVDIGPGLATHHQ